MTGGAGRIGTISGKQDTNVHFIGSGFEPTKVALYTVPGARPMMLFIDPVIRLTVNHKCPPFFSQFVKGYIGWDFEMAAHAHQVLLALGTGSREPWFDDSLRKRF